MHLVGSFWIAKLISNSFSSVSPFNDDFEFKVSPSIPLPSVLLGPKVYDNR